MLGNEDITCFTVVRKMSTRKSNVIFAVNTKMENGMDTDQGSPVASKKQGNIWRVKRRLNVTCAQRWEE